MIKTIFVNGKVIKITPFEWSIVGEHSENRPVLVYVNYDPVRVWKLRGIWFFQTFDENKT